MESSIIIYSCFALLSTLAVLLASLCFIETLQEQEYSTGAYWGYLRDAFRSDWMPFISTALVAFILKLAYAFLYGSNYMLAIICLYGADIIYICMIFSIYLSFRRNGPDIVFDGRTKGILCILLVMIAACSLSIFIKGSPDGSISLWDYMWRYFVFYMPGLLLPLFVCMANLLTALFVKKKHPVTLDAERESKE